MVGSGGSPGQLDYIRGCSYYNTHLPAYIVNACRRKSYSYCNNPTTAADLAGALWGEQVGVLAPSLAPPNLHVFARNQVRWARDSESNRSRAKRRGRANISQYGVAGVGRGWGYLLTPYLPQFFTESNEIKCIREGIEGRNDCAPRAGGARTLPDMGRQG